MKTIYKCSNRHCRAEGDKPGRCDTCAAMWEKTLEIARAAHNPEVEEEDDEDLMDYGYYDDYEDFGADMGISISDPLDYFD